MIRNGRTHHTQKAYKAEETNMDKIEKSSEEWRAELAPDVYHITREAAPSVRLAGNTTISMRRAITITPAAVLYCLNHSKNSTAIAAGRHFSEQAEPQSTYRVRDGPRHGARRSALPPLRCAFGACASRRAQAHRRALLHQFAGDGI